MTFDEVRAIIGEYPKAYSLACGPGPTQSGCEWHSANNESETIGIVLDANGKVTEKHYNSDLMTLLDKVRHWLHLN